MNRADLLAYVAGDLSKLLTATATGTSDDYAGLKDALDKTYETLGLDPDVDDVLASDQRRPARALARYFTLVKLRTDANFDFVDTSVATPGSQRRDSQAVASLDKLIEMAKAECAALGFTVDAEDQIQSGVFFMDFLHNEDEDSEF